MGMHSILGRKGRELVSDYPDTGAGAVLAAKDKISGRAPGVLPSGSGMLWPPL